MTSPSNIERKLKSRRPFVFTAQQLLNEKATNFNIKPQCFKLDKLYLEHRMEKKRRPDNSNLFPMPALNQVEYLLSDQLGLSSIIYELVLDVSGPTCTNGVWLPVRLENVVQMTKLRNTCSDIAIFIMRYLEYAVLCSRMKAQHQGCSVHAQTSKRGHHARCGKKINLRPRVQPQDETHTTMTTCCHFFL